MTTREELIKNLEKIKPYCVIIGYVGGRLDACICVGEKDFKNEKRKFDVYKTWGLIENKNQ